MAAKLGRERPARGTSLMHSPMLSMGAARRWSGRDTGSPPRVRLGEPDLAPLASGAGHTVMRYDQHGCGLSDRDTTQLSVDVLVGDLEAVIDASGHERFALLGVSGGARSRSPTRFATP